MARTAFAKKTKLTAAGRKGREAERAAPPGRDGEKR